ncbi:DUF4372 domain-containing protein [Woeseia oceani]|uniref:Transposase n=1 Tax=Woeseia oceani TaxID=1548547 RepID=A0A193LII8_9GAMM|nr:DUF4372 domain-containing protein [Woeseia oceani]ANO52317.1 hypothetical protein BA177_14995 [Woeseia oceani]
MAHSNTVLSQLLKLVPRHQFEALARAHHVGRRFRKTSRWSQFVALATGQLARRRSLRDIVSNLNAQSASLYHLGSGAVTRSTLARVNERQPCEFYEALFGKLYGQCRSIAPRHGFRFKNKLYSLDASTIELSLSIFPWAKFRERDGALKLHVGLDHDGGIPAFMSLTDGVDKAKGLRADQAIRLTDQKSIQESLPELHRVSYVDPESGQRYVFLTNNFALAASTIAAIYKQHWQIELFFKWIKQNLKITSFLGVSKNAVMTQVWVAMCVYLVLAYLKFLSRTTRSMQHILWLLQLNLFIRRDIVALLRGDPPSPIPISPQRNLALAR